MKKILLLLFIIPSSMFAQERIVIARDTMIKYPQKGSLLKVSEKELAVILSNGSLIQHGDKLKLGKGTLPNGDFNYIATPSNSMEAKLKRDNKLDGIKIIEIIKKGNKKYGFKYVFKCEGNYLIQLEDAIATGEIVLN